MRLRTFVAVDLEDELVRGKIVDIQREISSSSARIKLVEPENLHITLKFLGEVEETRIPVIVKALEGALKGVDPFRIRLERVGAFPRVSRPNVIWVGVSDGRDSLIRLANLVEDALRKVGFPKEKRSFEPHLTIARVKYRSSDLPSLITRVENVEIGEIEVREVRLKKSTLTPKGPIYETLHSFPLTLEGEEA